MEPIQQGPLRRWRLGRRTDEEVAWRPMPFVLIGMMLVAIAGYVFFADRHPDSQGITTGGEPAKRTMPAPGTAPPVSPPPIPR